MNFDIYTFVIQKEVSLNYLAYNMILNIMQYIKINSFIIH